MNPTFISVCGNKDKTPRSSKMVHYSCPRCGYATTLKGNMIKHLERKIVCEPIVADADLDEYADTLCKTNQRNMCQGCSKTFASPSGLHYHKSRCAKLQEPSEELDDMRTLLIETREELRRERERRQQLEQNSPQSITINIHNDHCNTVNINSFGQENTSYITDDFSKICLELKEDGLKRMIDKIYFDPDHEENHNVRHRSLKHSLVEVLQESGWVPKTLTEAVQQMVRASRFMIVNKLQPTLNTTDHSVLASINAIHNPRTKKTKEIEKNVSAKLIARKETRTS